MCKVGWDLWLVRVSCECTDTREKLHGWTKASSSIPSALMVSNQIPGTPPPDLLLRCVAGSPGCAGLSTYLGTVGWTPGGGDPWPNSTGSARGCPGKCGVAVFYHVD